MNKSGFTLIELLISITISSLILALLFETIQISKTSNDTYERAYLKKSEQANFLKSIHIDLTSADKSTIKIENKQNTHLLSFQTRNSYKAYNRPYVYYIYHDGKLLRAESKYPKLSKSKLLANDIDMIKSITKFKSYRDVNKSSILIYYTDNLKKEHLFQVPLF